MHSTNNYYEYFSMFLFCFQNLYYLKLIEEVQLHGMKINEIPQELHMIE